MAEELLNEGKRDSALIVLDKCMTLLPDNKVPYNNTLLSVINAYYKAASTERANELVDSLTSKMYVELDYYFSIPSALTGGVRDVTSDIQINMFILQELYKATVSFKQVDLSKDIEMRFMNPACYLSHSFSSSIRTADLAIAMPERVAL